MGGDLGLRWRVLALVTSVLGTTAALPGRAAQEPAVGDEPTANAPTEPSEPPEPQPEGDSPLAKAQRASPDETAAAEPLPIEAPELTWKPEWARAGAGNYTLIAGALAVTIAASILKPSDNHLIEGGLLFDDAVRDGLRADSQNTRYTARDSSDVLLSLGTMWPFAVDSLIVANGVRRSPDVAWEMAVIDAEVFALTAATQQVTTLLVSRPRPYVRNCGVSVSPDLNDCVRSSRFRSYFSGHTAFAFAGASLVCAHRARHQLFGGSADIAACAGAYVAAAATAMLRMVGDVHYATDTITGAIVGTAIGLGIPALHYSSWNEPVSGGLMPNGYELTVYPTGNGVGLAVVY